MKLYVLDTDIAGFVQQEHQTVVSRIKALPSEDTVATTIITFGEDLSGWLPACRRAPDGPARAVAYVRLQKGLEFYREMICLPFDETAATQFEFSPAGSFAAPSGAQTAPIFAIVSSPRSR